jgi:membrane-associated phospholipid phosphatase
VKAVLVMLALIAARPSSADSRPPWYRGKYGKNRVVHLSITLGAGGVYVLTEGPLKRFLAPETCHWCEPPQIDQDVRRALVWKDTTRAALLSNVTGYIAAPVSAFGFTLFSIYRESAVTSARVIDDMLPILETITISETALQIVKLSVGRQRPFVRFNPRGLHEDDDNLSFFSGHSALTFGLATSAGVIAHRRGYATEPYVWIVGMSLAASTAYLRIAADKHYLTDVALGSAYGIACGLTIPQLMDRDDIAVVPTGNGAAIVGEF